MITTLKKYDEYLNSSPDLSINSEFAFAFICGFVYGIVLYTNQAINW